MLLCVFVMLLVAAELSFCLNEVSLDAKWKEWKITYGKEYEDVEEVYWRTIWGQNMRIIEIHNQEAEQGKHSYKLGMNHRGDTGSVDTEVLQEVIEKIAEHKRRNEISEEMSDIMIEYNQRARDSIMDIMVELMLESDDMTKTQILKELSDTIDAVNREARNLILLDTAETLEDYNTTAREHILAVLAEKMIEYNRMSKQLIMEIMTVKMESGRMSQNEILGDLTEVMAECNLMSRELIMEEMAKTLANYDRTARMKAKFGYYKDQTTFNHNSTQKLHERSMKDIICTSSEKNNKSDSLPKSVDYREDGIVTGVRSQGNCGSCWAFSAAGALEGQLARKTGQLLELSPQNLVDCVLDKGCDGGYMGLAYKYVTDNGGLNSEEDYPYVGKKQKCRFKPSAVAAQCKGFKMIPKGDEDALAEALNDVGPLSVVLNVGDKTFDFYKTGIYYNPECDENQQSHAMLLVGYGETAKGEKYWIVKNSWGEHWGEKGYIRIARDCDNHCGIASQASYPLM